MNITNRTAAPLFTLLLLWHSIDVYAEDGAATATGHILKYGIFDVVKAGNVKADSSTGTGKIVSKPTIALREQTRRIPLEPDVHFGYQYRLSLPATTSYATLTRVLRHPEMVKPDGSRSTGSSRDIRERVKRGNVFALDGYALTEPYEMVEGEWVFQIWHERTLLVEQTFVTYPPEPTAAASTDRDHR